MGWQEFPAVQQGQNPALGEEQISPPVYSEGYAAGKPLGKKGPGGHPAEHEPAKCPCGKCSKWAPFDTGVSESWGRWSFHCTWHWGGHSWHLVSRFRFPSTRKTWMFQRESIERPQRQLRYRSISCLERPREVCLFSLEKGRLRDNPICKLSQGALFCDFSLLLWAEMGRLCVS